MSFWGSQHESSIHFSIWEICNNQSEAFEPRYDSIFDIFLSFSYISFCDLFVAFQSHNKFDFLLITENENTANELRKLSNIWKMQNFLILVKFPHISAIPIQMPQTDWYRCHRLKNGCQNRHHEPPGPLVAVAIFLRNIFLSSFRNALIKLLGRRLKLWFARFD